MIWIDITDPKYALFFHALLPNLLELDSVLITTRKSRGYDECAKILKKLGLKQGLKSAAHSLEVRVIGGYGGESLSGKFKARMQRQSAFLEMFSDIAESKNKQQTSKNAESKMDSSPTYSEKSNMDSALRFNKAESKIDSALALILPRVFLTGASVEGAQCAFGLGIPIVHFSDTPIAGHRFLYKDITLLSRLSLPLSSLVFCPFVLPKRIYSAFGLEAKNIISYPFIDVAMWLHKIGERLDSTKKAHGAKSSDKNALPLILAREEEYKAHYVKKRLRLWEEGVKYLAQQNLAKIRIIPRYEREYLVKRFSGYKNIEVLKNVREVSALYSDVDLMLGGGGTMNLEAAFLGIPTISTRSLLLYHDKYLIKNGLMKHAKNLKEVIKAFEEYRKMALGEMRERANCL